MRSSDVIAGNTILASDLNKLRDDAYASSWLLPHEQSSPNLTLKVENGTLYINEKRIDFAGGNSGSFTAPASNPRIDLLSINSSGTLVRTAGTEAASPSEPDCPVDQMPICYVYNRVGQTSVKDTDDSTNGYVYKDVRPALNQTSKLVLKMLAEQDLTGGQPVGVSGFKNDSMALAKKPYTTTPAFYSTGASNEVNVYDIVWLDGDKFLVCGTVTTSRLAFVACCTVDRATMNITIGNVETSIGAVDLRAMKICIYDTSKFAVFFLNTEDLCVDAYSISGTTVTWQTHTVVTATVYLEYVNALTMDTNATFVSATGQAGSTGNYMAYITWSSYTPTVVYSLSGGSALQSPFYSGWNAMVKLSTTKVLIGSGHALGSPNKHQVVVVTMSGSLAIGTPLSLGTSNEGQDPEGAYTDMVTYATDRALFRMRGDSSNSIIYRVIAVSGTTCSVMTELGDVNGTRGKMIYRSVASKVIEYSDTGDGSLYEIIPTDGGITRTQVQGPVDLKPNENYFAMAYNPTNDYFISMTKNSGSGGTSDVVKLRLFIMGMSTNFIGFVQGAVSRGSYAYVKLTEDAQQSSLAPGMFYTVADGAISATIDMTSRPLLIAKNASELLVT